MKTNKYLPHICLCLVFTLGLFGFECFYLPFIPEQTGLAARVGGYLLGFLSLLLLFVFTFFALAAPYKWRLVYFLIFTLGIVTEYGYYTALQHFSTAEDLENVIFGTNLDNKIDAVMIYINWAALLPCLVFLVLLLAVKPLSEKGLKNFGMVAAGALLFFLATGYWTNNYYPIAAVGAYYRTLIGSPFKLNYLNQTPRQLIEYRAPEKPSNNLVFIIDESISGSHLSINGYDRQTTPLLDELSEKGYLKNWGLAVSGTTCSITSNKLLLTGITDLPDLKKQLLNAPIIFQYAKAMGYKTFYFDGQMDNMWSISDFDRQFVDEHITKQALQTANDYEIDGEIARRVKELVGSSTGNFIWINKRGTHVPYQRAYPKSSEVWTPVFFADPLPTFATEEERKKAYINSHDNAVKYNLQLFFTTLLGAGVDKNTFYLYTSDHGQNLRDVPTQGSHCGDLPQQSIVPLLMIADPSAAPEVDTAYKASHSNVFATLLDLMHFPETERRFEYNLSLLKAKAADSKPRTYFVGNISGNSGGRKMTFEERLTISKK
jgi:glucan phosphoethanolaminetransferase (alkaline phosphatase superfamily)